METRRKRKEPTSWNRHMRGVESLWYYGYETSRAIAFDAQIYFEPSHGIKGNVFVPVSTVLGWGLPLPDNQSKDDNDDEANGENRVSAWTDEDLIDEAPADWRMPNDNKESGIKTPVRLGDGTMRNLQIRANVYPAITRHVRKVLSLGGGKSFKPTRQCDMPLEWPLLVKPLDRRKNLIYSRFGLSIDQFLQVLIEEVNIVNDESKQITNKRNAVDGEWKLQLYDDKPRTQGYKMMSKDPFELYSTWIHEDDWDSYMKMLAETQANPIRNFISCKKKNAYKALDDLMLAVGARDLMIQDSLSSEKRESLGLDPNQNESDKAALSEPKKRQIRKVIKEKRIQGIESQFKTYKFNNGQATINVELSAAKMNAASGKRPSQLTQTAVMGGVSASKIATSLGWEKERLASGFFSSEWLHLSAFSWGGFLPAGEKSGFSTSQNLENLIFGTSETNSLMTSTTDQFVMERYEMAWQDLYREEQKIQDRKAKANENTSRPLQGQLSIHCNNFSNPIRRDFFDSDNKYKFGEFTIPEESVNRANATADEQFESEDPHLMCKAYASSNDTSQRHLQDLLEPENAASYDEMLALAYDFPFVVYSIEYTIQNDFKSIILDEASTRASFQFYPFHRSLYHQAEAVLDALVWKRLKEGADSWLERHFGEKGTEGFGKGDVEANGEKHEIAIDVENTDANDSKKETEAMGEEQTEAMVLEDAEIDSKDNGTAMDDEGR
ncbi:hypothetical protein CFIO01_05332 [Colletotrichum fioriniae PJ7]|uniref:Uncharacterized protein n=1 Tax=Colletotrichum fioriniae PJ7 TaxID=1445577 RepID=A0A010R6B0_9PEZI|nr:hypothetical protein CFIO01_05332 [Colletotrichum fioriniae PJ7]